MLRISKLTDYATLILAHLAEPGAKRHTASEVAVSARIALPTVSKVLKELQRAGLVASTRGAHGGYALARPARSITAADIIDAVEGPVALTECGLEASCRVGASWQRVSLAIRQALSEVTLTQLVGAEALATQPVRLGSRDATPVVWRGRV
jgi:FeS assembly SUF system regulator